MHFANCLTALTILGIVAHVQAKAVFAHFMVGNIFTYLRKNADTV